MLVEERYGDMEGQHTDKNMGSELIVSLSRSECRL
jgi:hypothetical protein